ncbi:M23 family metallopeptidase [Mariprofundus erugo]|uniref:M23 family metallopeptidase n=1 Tax=Mariprofundus erugo TaxID=2528639 RepID=UPI0010FD7B66|nr:M23 family metallopeptidase [Mariprofundus erugo]TLS78199.1 M23 family metallopeptidase [Mariprofundus erugo]
MAVARRVFLLLVVLSLAACYHTSVGEPASRAAPVVSQKNSTYIVRSGDTLYSIGKRFGVDYHRLAARNRLRAPYHIFIGQQLYISTSAPPETRLPVATGGGKRQTVRVNRHVLNSNSKSKSREVVAARPAAPVARHATSAGSEVSRQPRATGYESGKLLWPVKGVVTSRFGHRGSRMHDGIDIGVPEGTAVHAAGSGEVVYSDSRISGYGRLIIIRHGRDLFTAYAHNQRNLVRKGDRVRAGDVIARAGHTGRASGPHLHFEVRQGSTPVDPLAYLPR